MSAVEHDAPFQGIATVEVYTITDVERADKAFQGHHLLGIEADAAIERRSFDDAVLVPTAQALGTLAVYLLEPESEDGLAAWGLFDEGLDVGVEFPVYRVRAAIDAEPTTPNRPPGR